MHILAVVAPSLLPLDSVILTIHAVVQADYRRGDEIADIGCF
jgi:hypothetical protein